MMRRLVPLTLVLALAGCGLFRAQQKAYFTIDALPPAGAAAPAEGLPVGIDTFQLPPPVERREIAVREENGELDVRGRELWAAPLEALVMHALAFDLAARLPEGMVVLPGQAKPVGAMRSVRVIAETFEAGPRPVVVLDARWVLAAPGDAVGVTTRERIEIPLDSLESAHVAAGMSRALADLADRIAAAL